MSIVLLVEGATETALKGNLKEFLDGRAEHEQKPKVRLQTKPLINLNAGHLRSRIRLEVRQHDVQAMIGLIDVYPKFADAAKAIHFLREVAEHHPRFYAHAAQYDVEAWLLPYWDDICNRIRVKQSKPGSQPEQVNDQQPPSKRLWELYRRANPPRKYIKQIEMTAILRDKDLGLAAVQCPEFKSFLNTLLTLGDLRPL